MTLPATFTVGVSEGVRTGSARLVIAPGVITFEPGRLLRTITSVGRTVHTRPKVKLIRTRLVPPWMSMSLVISGERGAVAATPWFFDRRRLREALGEAGFEVDEVRTWFSMGGRKARQ